LRVRDVKSATSITGPLPKGGFGNLIALPLQKRPREQGNSVFLTELFNLILINGDSPLVDWASRPKDAGELLPLPQEFQRHTLQPFRK